MNLPDRLEDSRGFSGAHTLFGGGRPQRGPLWNGMHIPHANTLAVTVFANLLPLAGVLLLGWDIYVLLIFYWCETAIIGFWTVITVALHRGEVTWSFDGPTKREGQVPWAIAIFLALHAGFFMAVHLFLLSALYGNAWPGSLRSPLAFFETFVIDQRLWPMLALVFVHQAMVFVEVRQAHSVVPSIVGLYMRIVVMQVVLIIGAWGVMLTGSGLFGLCLLVAGRAALDLFWPQVLKSVMSAMEANRK